VTEPQLTDRQSQLIRAFVRAWEADSPGSAHSPFDFPAGGAPIEHPNWPPEVPVPSRDEVRTLHHLGLLDVDDRFARAGWRLMPTARARGFAGVPDDTAALRDPDQRLGFILEATVRAFSQDASQPLHFADLQQTTVVQHPGWNPQPGVVQRHDLAQLEDLGMIGVERVSATEMNFWPTTDARMAFTNTPRSLSALPRTPPSPRNNPGCAAGPRSYAPGMSLWAPPLARRTCSLRSCSAATSPSPSSYLPRKNAEA
jgi:hypothetical protein